MYIIKQPGKMTYYLQIEGQDKTFTTNEKRATKFVDESQAQKIADKINKDNGMNFEVTPINRNPLPIDNLQTK